MCILCGCSIEESTTTISVNLIESEGCTVLNNGKNITSGDDVVFELAIEDGYAFSSIDYDGEYYFENHGTRNFLRICNVRYPLRTKVNLTNNFCTITYHSNDSANISQSITYDKTYHIRPNTSIGSDLFTRDGYTLYGWNTSPDGSGISVGLGSRINVSDEGLELYAQWAKWDDAENFTWSYHNNGIVINDYIGTSDTIVIPATISGYSVTAIAQGAFTDCIATSFILPNTLYEIESGAFQNCAFSELTLFDNLEVFGDDSFLSCTNFKTLHINAVENPYGYDTRRESCFADKIDLLIAAQNQKKIVFYGGCSMWYNLDGQMVYDALGNDFNIINLGLNGTINSAVQMQIITSFLESGDVFFHTPELSSSHQLLIQTAMEEHDEMLWSGLEYNYDLVSLVDLSSVPNLLDSFQFWLSQKECTSSYNDVYRDSNGRLYLDNFGCIPFTYSTPSSELLDEVYLNPSYINEDAMTRLADYYNTILKKNVKVYISYACVNVDALTLEERDNVELMDKLFSDCIEKMDGPILISSLSDYLYHNTDFYDTNYHLLTEQTKTNTSLWLRDLLLQMSLDGLISK